MLAAVVLGGLLARTNNADPLPTGGPRANHDVLVSAVVGTARGECGLVTSAGRLIKINALDLPTVPATANMPNLQGGTHVSELITLGPDERVLCLTTLATDSLGLALGTAQGVVKRVNPEVLGRDSWEVIRLDPGDRVVGAVELTTADVELTFSPMTASCCTSRPHRYAPKAGRAAAWPGSSSVSAAAWSSSGRCRPRARSW